MYDSTLNASGELSDGGYDLHDLIDLGDSTDEDLVITHLPLPAPPAFPNAVVTKDKPQLEVEDGESEYEEEGMKEVEEEEKEDEDEKEETKDETKEEEEEEYQEEYDEEEKEGNEETQVRAQQAVVVQADSDEEQEESAEEEEEEEKVQVAAKETPPKEILPPLPAVQNKGGDEQKHTARCSVPRGRGRGRGRGGAAAAAGVRGSRAGAPLGIPIYLFNDKGTTHPGPNTNKTPTPSVTPSPRGRGRPRGSAATNSPRGGKNLPPAVSSPSSPTCSVDISIDGEDTPPTSPATSITPTSSGGTKPVIMTEDHFDMVGVKTPPLTPTPTPTKKMVQRKRRVSESSPTPAFTPDGAVAGEGTLVKKKRVHEIEEAPAVSSPQKPERSTVAVQTDIPASPSKRKPKFIKKPAHWTREEMMLLFHEIYPRKYEVDWSAVARMIGREPSECQAKLPALITDLENFLNKHPTI